MSIIIAIATNNRIIIKSDGRELDQNRNIITESSQKILNLGKTVIGFTGSTLERSKIMRHLVSLYGETLNASAQALYESARSFCRSGDISDTVAMIIASTQNHALFLKQFSSIDGFVSHDCLASPLPVVALAGDIALPFNTYDPNDIESSMNQYIINTSRIQETVGKTIFTEILVL